MRPPVAASFALALLASSTAWAADGLRLGMLEVRSALGAPFDAELTVEVGDAPGKLVVGLADAQAYAERGVARPAALEALRFAVAPIDERRARVRVTSAVPMREPSLQLLVEARVGGARSQREFTVLLDPPGGAAVAGATRPVMVDSPEPAGPVPGGPDASFDVGEVSVEVVWEFDAYYTSVGANVPLTDEPVPEGGSLSEWEVYRKLFLDSFHPRVLLLEASVYPMPVLGTYVREHSPDTYDSFKVGSTDINLLETITAGFQEPWAVSAFIGSEMNFSRPGEKRKGTNKGYMGYLVSYGAKHIKDNVLIDDDWWEFEWKLKGTREFKDEQLSWSFRTGVKTHAHPLISDIIYLGARRSSLDFKAGWLSWLANSSFDLTTEFTQDHFEFARTDLVFGKKFPFKSKGFALSLEFGVIYEKDLKYLGVLADPADPSADDLTLVVRPNIEF